MKEWSKAFYKSKAWENTREAYLRSQGYLCERCKKQGRITPAKIVHHKTYLTPWNITNPEVCLSFRNLEALCQDCHNKEHHSDHVQERYSVDDFGRVTSPPIEKF